MNKRPPRKEDIVIVMGDDGDTEEVVHTVLSVQFIVRLADGKDLFLMNKYEGIDWKHKP